MYTKENEHASLRDKNVTGRENVASLVSYLLKLSRLQPNTNTHSLYILYIFHEHELKN